MKWINHEREARVIYSLTTDRQPGIYWETNRLLARLYFDSNIYETTKSQVYPSDVSSFMPLHERNPAENFDCYIGIYNDFVFDARKRRNTV